MEVFVEDGPVSLAVRLVIKFAGIKQVKITTVNDSSKGSEPFKSLSPKGEVPAIKGSSGQTAVGFLDVFKTLLGNHPTLGTTDATQKEVAKWLKLTTTDLLPFWKEKTGNRWTGKLHKLNKDLQPFVFFLGNELTVVDLVLLPLLHESVKNWSDSDRLLFCNLTRWVDFMQHQPSIQGELPLVSINKYLDAQELPQTVQKGKEKPVKTEEVKKEEKQEEKKEQPKKEEDKKEEKKEEPAKGQQAAKGGEKKEQQKGKQDAKQQQPKKGEAAKPQENKPIDIYRLDIRVGKIVNVKRHENAESLYVEEIDLGEAKPRTIVSGLVNFIPIDQMQNRFVLVLSNLKPAKLRGVTSEGMVLAASNADHTKVELLDPPKGSKIGERVTFDGHPGEPDPVLDPKNKVFETLQPEFTTTSDFTAVWKDIPFKTSAGIVKAQSIVKATIK